MPSTGDIGSATGAGAGLLPIYLNDHLAGSTTVIELVRRAAREHEGTELGAFLRRLGVEISADRGALRRLMAAAGARPHLGKVALAWAGEKVGRLKLNGRLLRRSPLSPLVELEAIELGIHGKRLLWQVLHEQRPAGSDAVDLVELISRAERQLGDVERHRLAAGAALLGRCDLATVAGGLGSGLESEEVRDAAYGHHQRRRAEG